MKILFLTDGFFPFQIGGMQKHSAVLIRLLAERGVKLTVIHPGGKDFSEQKLNELFPPKTGIEFIHIPFPSLGRLPGHYLRENRQYSRSCLQAVQNGIARFDLIYVQGFTGSAFMRLRQKNMLRVPVVLNLHGLEMFQKISGFKNKLANFLLRREAHRHLEMADYVYSFGGQIDSILIDLKIPAAKILSHANGIEESWIVKEPAEHEIRRFVFVGRNERRKGLAELNQSLSQLLQKIELKFEFHFIGPLNETEKITDDRIVYHGELRDTEKIKVILDSADCLVVPSFSEGMPTVILEAMARGMVIIATNVGAVSRMIDGNGILISKPEVHLISDAVSSVIRKTNDELHAMKKRSLDLVREKYCWAAVADSKMIDFRRIIEEKN